MNIGARYAINLMTSFEVAVIVAYVIGMVTAFVLSKRFVFRRVGTKGA